MPQVNPSESNVSRVIANDSKTVRERLYDRFKPHEYVRVKNIDDEDFEWQYMPVSAEEETIEDGGATHAVYGRKGFNSSYTGIIPGNEQLWKMEAGDSEVLLGENAYLFIDGLYKRVVAKRAIEKSPNQPSTQARNFNWTDGQMQEKLINEILIGVEKPQFGNYESPKKQAVK